MNLQKLQSEKYEQQATCLFDNLSYVKYDAISWSIYILCFTV